MTGGIFFRSITVMQIAVGRFLESSYMNFSERQLDRNFNHLLAFLAIIPSVSSGLAAPFHSQAKE